MNIEAAKAEIKRTEAILRSRYHYAHPVFDHLAAALEHLEAEAPAEPQETVAQLKAEAEEAVAVGEAEVSESAGASEEAAAEPKLPATRARRRG